MIKPVTIDFETEAIERRPYYPPKPTAVSILQPGKKRAERYVWGHPEGNNCTKERAQQALRDVWKSGASLLFQNASFDVDVAQVHMDMPDIGGERIHDTLYLLFLHDPYASSLSLKPAAERILGMKPEERDAVREWLIEHRIVKKQQKDWGAYICKAPGSIVGPYMDGDCIRTRALFNHLYPSICKRNMQAAYDRERRLMPIMLENERQGMHIDLEKLEHDYVMYRAAIDFVDSWLRKRLKTPNLNIDSDDDFADALEKCKVVTGFKMTAKGNRSVSKKNLTVDMFRDAQVASAYGYRNRLATCLATFMETWLAQARETNGIVHTHWNQVRQSHDERNLAGARTGRMSSTPNFMNVPKNWKRAFAEGYKHPDFIKGFSYVWRGAKRAVALPELPFMRRYFLPDAPDHLWGRRDYNQQELRILAHFEDGDLLRHYNEDPRFDHHKQVQDLLKEAGNDLPRDSTKILNFQDIYGGGATALAEALKITVQQASDIKKAKRSLLPDFVALDEDIKQRGKAGLSIRTWGGREYFTEPAKYSEKYKRVMTFEYKLLNYLIQGSAADCTKESVIRYHAHPKKEARFLVTVHDENNISAHKKIFKEQMKVLKEVMMSVEFDLPMLSDGEFGQSWGTLEALKED